MAKKKPIPDDCMPCCENCNAGVFERGEVLGECHAAPMKWIPIAENGATPMWDAARVGGWCRLFQRKTH